MQYRLVCISVLAAVGLWASSNWAETPREMSWLDSLIFAPDTIAIKGRRYFLSARASRDFMPTPEASEEIHRNGRPLSVGVRLIAGDSLAIPKSLNLDSAWVINVWTLETWGVKLRQQEWGRHHNVLEKFAGGGPMWDPGTPVDIVARIVAKNNKKRYLLRVPTQPISRDE